VAKLPGVRLVIVGSGPAEQVARRALPGAVFMGQCEGEHLAKIYASMDVFVHAGPHDTFGQTLQEAAASGLPVIAPAAGGPLDLVQDGVTGFLVRPCDASALAVAVAKLVADPALRAVQSKAGRQMVLGRTWPVMCEELIWHYLDVLDGVGATQRAAVAA
jgi:phosphatidylinositol alpha 1,6-mannosyltransferase